MHLDKWDYYLVWGGRWANKIRFMRSNWVRPWGSTSLIEFFTIRCHFSRTSARSWFRTWTCHLQGTCSRWATTWRRWSGGWWSTSSIARRWSWWRSTPGSCKGASFASTNSTLLNFLCFFFSDFYVLICSVVLKWVGLVVLLLCFELRLILYLLINDYKSVCVWETSIQIQYISIRISIWQF